MSWKELRKDTKQVLIIGPAHSGTSILCAMLGRHKEISMLYEPSGAEDVFKQYGTTYIGAKYIYWNGIRLDVKASKAGHLINRIINFGSIDQKRKFRPISQLCIKDFHNPKILTTSRNRLDNVKSLVRRKGFSVKYADKYLDRYYNDLHSDILKDYDTLSIKHSMLRNQNYRELTALNICSFLKLEYDPNMLDCDRFNIKFPEYLRGM